MEKVLLMDLDAQWNASYGLGIRMEENIRTDEKNILKILF